ncbi:ribosomal protein L30 [Tremella mesenterica]|uniref:Large ribosomal subunit protein uL30m n=1 Tax=Tremella mesenterica TaxID=5217 RepID=A0A4Q1BV98_TREME|nr:uncharacterized protein TREMEDRAFT_72853 [Tremella mesenterica DSM 1558]EIW72702.1 hypothetical protein TREMEDRAFT_72853 [Tremella mesenterica DSM 1558]RXK42045.1 ribosomal protein L30 [Tremella mesenterica]
MTSFIRSIRRLPISHSFRQASTSTSPSSSVSATQAPRVLPDTTVTHHLITLTRSPIGLPPQARGTLEALGLYRRYSSVLHPFGPTVAGQILRVKELVSVRNVTEEEGIISLAKKGSEGSGVVVSGRVFGGGKGVVM